MKISYRKILIISCISFPLHAMEKETPPMTDTNTSLINSNSNNSNFYPINSIYKQTASLLDNFNLADHEHIIALSAIITRTKELKTSNIMEQDISSFAFQQKSSSFFFTTRTHPCYTSLFFKRLAGYNAKLETDKTTSPTPEQFACHRQNQKIKSIIQRCRTINIDTPDEKDLLITLPTDIAISAFEQLIHDTKTLLAMPLEEIIDMANLKSQKL